MSTEVSSGRRSMIAGGPLALRIPHLNGPDPGRLPRPSGSGAAAGATSRIPAALAEPVRARFGAFELDEANARLLRDGRPLPVAPTPFAVLCTLVRQAGSLISKNTLLDTVWGHRFVSDAVLKTAISDLRTVLQDDARRPRYIETASRRGYRFIGVTSETAVAHSSRSALPASLPSAAPVAGRSRELTRLRAAWNDACAGKRTFVWIAGDPGIGKTTLIDGFVASLGGVMSARGQCVQQYGSGEPYLPILDALADLSRRDDTVVPLLHSVAPAWLAQLPWLGSPEQREALGGQLADLRQECMLRQMGEFLDRYTRDRPLLLVTEDLHWSDRQTLQLMDHLARRRGNGQLMWLSSFRLAEVVGHDCPFRVGRHELRLHGLCEEIVLDPFSEQEVASFIAQRAPSLAANESLVRAVHERTDGLPSYLSQVVDDLLARGELGTAEASAASPLPPMRLPENLAGIIEHYVTRLSGDERAVLEAAAVTGGDFRVDVVAAMLGREVESVASVCDNLARGRLWVQALPGEGRDAAETRYSFRRAVFRQWLGERLGSTQRAALQRKGSAALERQLDECRAATAASFAV